MEQELSTNSITDASPLDSLSYLVSLNLEANALETLNLERKNHLQVLNVANNKLTTAEGLTIHPSLTQLIISGKTIS